MQCDGARCCFAFSITWQVRRVDQTRYPMTVAASLSAVKQACHTPLPMEKDCKQTRNANDDGPPLAYERGHPHTHTCTLWQRV